MTPAAENLAREVEFVPTLPFENKQLIDSTGTHKNARTGLLPGTSMHAGCVANLLCLHGGSARLGAGTIAPASSEADAVFQWFWGPSAESRCRSSNGTFLCSGQPLTREISRKSPT